MVSSFCKKYTKGQISVEYMLVMGFVTMITIPLVVVYMTFNEDSNTEIASAQLSQVVKKIGDAAESMYYLGEPSQTTLILTIPGNVVSANVSSSEIIYMLRTPDGISEIVGSARVNISGALPSSEGTYTLVVAAKDNYVEVSYT